MDLATIRVYVDCQSCTTWRSNSISLSVSTNLSLSFNIVRVSLSRVCVHASSIPFSTHTRACASSLTGGTLRFLPVNSPPITRAHHLARLGFFFFFFLTMPSFRHKRFRPAFPQERIDHEAIHCTSDVKVTIFGLNSELFSFEMRNQIKLESHPALSDPHQMGKRFPLQRGRKYELKVPLHVGIFLTHKRN